jgi:hypothetical protein
VKTAFDRNFQILVLIDDEISVGIFFLEKPIVKKFIRSKVLFDLKAIQISGNEDWLYN